MTTILINRQDASKIEGEEKVNWAINVLKTMGVPVDDFPKEPTMNNLRKIRGLLKKLEIDLIDDSDAGLKIYLKGKPIAEWLRPTYVLKENLREVDPKYRYYLEMTLNHRSVSDEK
jgi:hypothetical protein